MRYLLCAQADLVADALWQRYAARERQARGLGPTDSLDIDTRTGLPVYPPVTVRYCAPLKADARLAPGYVAMNAFVASLEGQSIGGAVIMDANTIDEAALPETIRPRPPVIAAGRIGP